jgi:hypothetical protein
VVTEEVTTEVGRSYGSSRKDQKREKSKRITFF